jgi:deoxycytidylate deaminase
MFTSQSEAGAWPEDQELIVGIVAPIGVELDPIESAIVDALGAVAYDTRTIKLTDLLQRYAGFHEVPLRPANVRYDELMTMGNRLRDEVGRPSAMAMLAVLAITGEREAMVNASPTVERRAYILRQLKRPEEVEALRQLYGENFVLIAGYSDHAHRVDVLARKIAASQHSMDNGRFTPAACELIQRDDREDGAHGQDLRDTFWRSDLFVDPRDDATLRKSVRRFVDLLFGRRVSTPTRDEFGMYLAWASAMRSGSLARQVGAVIADERGSVIATGTNDVPRNGGGLYWEDDDDDQRDHRRGADPSDALRRTVVEELFDRLATAGWLSEDRQRRGPSQLAHDALLGEEPILRSARVNAIIEFTRSAHAEQSAITDAARRGASTDQAWMAVTTFPCHECARLIVAAGIARVCFIEPYPKSLVEELHGDAVSVGRRETGKVVFEPFLGVSPRIYDRVFSSEGRDRKDRAGAMIVPEPSDAQLRLTYGGSRPALHESEATFIAALGFGLRGNTEVEQPAPDGEVKEPAPHGGDASAPAGKTLPEPEPLGPAPLPDDADEQ